MSSSIGNTIFNFPGAEVFGFKGKCVNNPPIHVYEKAWQINVLNSGGYCPGLSLLTGSFKIVIASQNFYQRGWKENPNAALVLATLFRGIIEVLQLGILLFIIDIIFTVGRLLTGTSTSRSFMEVPIELEAYE